MDALNEQTVKDYLRKKGLAVQSHNVVHLKP